MPRNTGWFPTLVPWPPHLLSFSLHWNNFFHASWAQHGQLYNHRRDKSVYFDFWHLSRLHLPYVAGSDSATEGSVRMCSVLLEPWDLLAFTHWKTSSQNVITVGVFSIYLLIFAQTAKFWHSCDDFSLGQKEYLMLVPSPAEIEIHAVDHGAGGTSQILTMSFFFFNFYGRICIFCIPIFPPSHLILGNGRTVVAETFQLKWLSLRQTPGLVKYYPNKSQTANKRK